MFHFVSVPCSSVTASGPEERPATAPSRADVVLAFALLQTGLEIRSGKPSLQSLDLSVAPDRRRASSEPRSPEVRQLTTSSYAPAGTLSPGLRSAQPRAGLATKTITRNTSGPKCHSQGGQGRRRTARGRSQGQYPKAYSPVPSCVCVDVESHAGN